MQDSHLIWLDLEMTGLDTEKNRIIEMATLVTNSDLDIIAEGPVFAIHQPDHILSMMDAWNVKHHTESGLIKRVQKSTVTEAQAEEATLAFLKDYAQPRQAPLCGNSVWVDRRFLARYMPELEQYFHYRIVDVSTIKELAKRWAPDVYDKLRKNSKHQALEDIKESVDELKHYRQHFFKQAT